MTDVALRVEGISKAYRIGGPRAEGRTLREAVMAVATMPFRGRRARADDAAHRTLWALRDVSFDVRPGEVLGIVGNNGAGKSTLLKLLSRITEPTAGWIGVRGRVGSLIEIGAGFHPELTGRENIYLNGAVLGMRRAEIERKFDAIVAFAEVERFLETQVKHYSSGMYMRLAFAIAAHLEPEILLVDEVLAVGDQHFQKKCLGQLGQSAKAGRTVLFVSHNLHLVKRLCSRAIWLEGGGVRADGDATETVNAYLASTVAPQGTSAARSLDAIVGGARRAYFTSWRLSGAEPYTLRADDELTLSFDVRVVEPLRGVFFGIALWAEGGTLVWGAASHDEGGAMDLAAGRYELRCEMGRVPLNAGVYSLEVSINVPGDQLDRWQAQPAFTLVATRTTLLAKDWDGFLCLPHRLVVRPAGDP